MGRGSGLRRGCSDHLGGSIVKRLRYSILAGPILPVADSEVREAAGSDVQGDASCSKSEASAPASAVDVVAPSASVRRRLNQKTKPVGVWAEAAVGETPSSLPPPRVPWDQRERFPAKQYAAQLFAARMKTTGTLGGLNHAQRRKILVKEFQMQLPMDQRRYVQRVWAEYAQRCGVPTVLPPLPPLPALSETGGPTGQKCVGGLLTWNGSWCLDDPAVQWAMQDPTRASSRGVSPDEPADCSDAIAAICRRLGKVPVLQDLWEEFQQMVKAGVKGGGLGEWSASMELSVHSADAGRVHMHLFVTLPADQWQRWVRMTTLKTLFIFRDKSASHVSPCHCGRGAGARLRAQRQGLYYAQAPKLGSIFSVASAPAHSTFLVSAKWVHELWRSHKLSYEGARAEILRTRDGVQKWLGELDATRRAEDGQVVKQQVLAARCHALVASFKPAVPLEIDWLKQYSHLETPQNAAAGPRVREASAPSLRRFRLLIYDGPSRTGKTERAVHWFGPERTLVIGCQNVTTPNLRGYRPGQHFCIVFDEGSWALVAQNRQLFQAGPYPVMLGQSPCNDLAYEVFIHGVALVVTSNAFWDKASQEARAWIDENSFYVPVAGPTYVTPAQVAACEASAPCDPNAVGAPESSVHEHV